MRETILEVCGNPESKEVIDLAKRLNVGYQVHIRKCDSDTPMVRGPNGEIFAGTEEINATFFPE